MQNVVYNTQNINTKINFKQSLVYSINKGTIMQATQKRTFNSNFKYLYTYTQLRCYKKQVFNSILKTLPFNKVQKVTLASIMYTYGDTVGITIKMAVQAVRDCIADMPAYVVKQQGLKQILTILTCN